MVKKIDTIKRLRLFGDFLMLGTFLLLLWLFLSAYMNGSFTSTIHINNYGEAHIEMIVLVFFLLPLFLLTAALSFLDWRQTWKVRQKILSQHQYYSNFPGSIRAIPQETLKCPGCRTRFDVKRIYSDGTIVCPTCGMIGTYNPDEPGHENGKPVVKIIKNIR